MIRKRLLALALLALGGAFAQAQIATGNVYGKVTDDSGAVLPGANVSISGEAGSRATTTGSGGEFRFLNLDYGSYTVTVALQGFAGSSRTVQVVTGQNVDLAITMKIGALTDVIEVSAEAPLVDVKKRGTATTIDNEQLK
ncbi:MAG TPA: carboxypeptidase-like regulatory domain-containing protein, partial [Vicinamibacteria bacterium]|nr:carboxypeptidase-like regulatory domain-containing protein [Vicinamibacteria bacterium]